MPLPDIRQNAPAHYKRKLSEAERKYLLALRRAVRAERIVREIEASNPLLVKAAEEEGRICR